MMKLKQMISFAKRNFSKLFGRADLLRKEQRQVKICFLGNSHLTCLIASYRDNPMAHPQMAPDFIASKGGLISKMELVDQHLVPTSEESLQYFKRSTGRTRVKISDFDQFVIVGAGLLFSSIDARHSSAVKKKCVENIFQTSSVPVLLSLVKNFGKLPPIVVGHPLFSEEAEDFKYSNSCTPYNELADIIEPLIESNGAVFVRQPAETIAGRIHTRKEFSDGAPKLLGRGRFGQTRVQDFKHMNSRYGAIMLDAVLKRSAEMERKLDHA